MTVIQFGYRDLKIHFGIAALVSVLMLSVVWSIFLYNRVTNLRHDVFSGQTALQQLQVKDAELKNRLYHMMDTALSDSFIQTSGLVVDKNPTYVSADVIHSSLSQSTSL
ncbi:MAG: hypothetical protein WC246_02735 [Candidatus Paceibacterota bacterium]|jgi:hypothetical protein